MISNQHLLFTVIVEKNKIDINKLHYSQKLYTVYYDILQKKLS